MKVSFIACEYNPFHNGHKYQLSETKKCNTDAIVCIMSGNFVQRGDIAVAEKHIRAKTAILNGADLVIELPLKYAISTASLFAEGFIKTANATGLDGIISFGAKNTAEELIRVKDIIFSEEAEKFAKERIRDGISYPTAKSMYLNQKLSNCSENILDDANNVLALEYLNAKDKFFPEAEIYTVKRDKAPHNSDKIQDNFASASHIRSLIYTNKDVSPDSAEYSELIPENVKEILNVEFADGHFPTDINKYDTALMSRLHHLTESDFSEVNNVTEGLENRIYSMLSVSNSTSELLDNVKTKRFTYARLRQIFINAALKITKHDINSDLSYIRILAFNEKGREVLHKMKDTATIPVIMNLSDIDKNDLKAVREAELDYKAGKLFNLCLMSPYKGNSEYQIPPYVHKT